MQPASYQIEVLRAGTLVSSTLAGFFSLSDTAAYVEEAERTIQTCFRQHGHYRMLLDVSGCAIQSQDVIAAFIAHVQRMPVSSRSAIVVGSSVVRMQVRRVMDRPNVAVFENLTDALVWVDEESPRQAA